MAWQICFLTNETKTTWDRFVKAQKGLFLFETNFLAQHKGKLHDASVLIFKNNLLQAIMPAHYTAPHALSSHQGLTFGGVLFAEKMPITTQIELLKALFEFLHQQNIQTLNICPVPHVLLKNPCDQLLWALKICQAQTIYAQLNFYLNKEAHFHLTKEKGIEKAKQKGLVFLKNTPPSAFWEHLSRQLFQKHNKMPTHDLTQINILMQRFPEDIFSFGIWHNQEVQAAAIVFRYPKAWHVQYFYSSPEGKRKRAQDLLMRCLQNEMPKDFVLSLGVCTQKPSQQIDKNLMRWKQEYGAFAQLVENYLLETAKFDRLSAIFA